MFKKLFSLILVLALVLGTVPAYAAGKTLEIDTADELLRLAENCRIDSYSRDLTVKLTADIDLHNSDFQGIPIFCGSFDGQGHTVSGIDMRGDGSYQGFFRYLTAEAQVKELRLKGTFSPGGSRSSVGALAGSNAGLISACTVEATVSGADKVGGIAGENLVGAAIEDSSFSGTLSGSHFVGGIAGDNLGVIRRCENRGEINTTAQQNAVSITEVTLDSIMGSESVNTVTDVGGIAGSSQGYIHDCANRGPVGYSLMGYNIGGIVGSSQGYIANCKNYANISGRREVGGIVGQMEPTAFISFQRDALQMLETQMNGLSASIGGMGAGAQTLGGTVSQHVSQMMIQAQSTQQALGAVLGDGLNEDSYIAAQNVLSGSFANLQITMQSMMNGVSGAVNSISGSISAMAGQVEEMRATLGNIKETVGGTMKDVSDNDRADILLGKLEGCDNRGNIHGDMNIGGITGAIAFENDLDLAEDVELGENDSLNFVSEIRAVILSCENSGQVSVRHYNGGGIVGMTSFGLVKNCASAAGIFGGSSDYVGGIAGKSDSFIRSCSAKGELEGAAYVGGIAGEGVTVSDCRSMVELSGTERMGAVLGYGQQSLDDNNSPRLRGNVYFSRNRDYGGIDGVSYSGVAYALSEKRFFALEGLSDIFNKVELSFVQENGDVSVVTIDTGSHIKAEDIPVINEKSGCLSHWEGLEDVAYNYDTSFHAAYTPMTYTLESRQKNAGGLPVILAEGSFHPESRLEYIPENVSFSLAEHEKLIDVFSYESSDGSSANTIRYRVGETDKEIRAFVLDEEGRWQPALCSVSGSYAVVELPDNARSIALIGVGTPLWVYAAVVVAVSGSILLIMLFCGIKRRRKRRKLKKEKALAAR